MWESLYVAGVPNTAGISDATSGVVPSDSWVDLGKTEATVGPLPDAATGILSWLISLVFSFSPAGQAHQLAEVIQVPAGSNLQEAFDVAEDGATLVLADGTYLGSGPNEQVLKVNRSITIQANSSRQAVLVGDLDRRVISIEVLMPEKVILVGLVIKGGSTSVSVCSSTIPACSILYPFPSLRYPNTRTNAEQFHAVVPT